MGGLGCMEGEAFIYLCLGDSDVYIITLSPGSGLPTKPSSHLHLLISKSYVNNHIAIPEENPSNPPLSHLNKLTL